MIQELVVLIVDNKKEKIISSSKEDDINGLFKGLVKFCSDLKEKLEDSLWGRRFDTPAQKLGNHDASVLISQLISNQKIYQEHPGINLQPSDVKKIVLFEFVTNMVMANRVPLIEYKEVTFDKNISINREEKYPPSPDKRSDFCCVTC